MIIIIIIIIIIISREKVMQSDVCSAIVHLLLTEIYKYYNLS